MIDRAASSGFSRYRRLGSQSRRRSALRSGRALVAGLTVCLTAPAGAQEEEDKPPETEVRLGSRIPWPIERPTASQREGTRVLYLFADCIVERQPADALALLQMEPGAPQHSEVLGRIVGKENRCLRATTMRLSVVPFRGAIANALYTLHYPTFAADRLPQSPDTAGAMLSGNPDALMSDFARCVVRTDPVAVDALLRTRPASDAEHDSLRALSVHFSSCLFQGQSLSANPLGLRSVLAEAAYRLSIGAVPAPAAER